MKYKGTNAEDVFLGTAAADFIEGMGGKDRLAGAGGNDTIIGGSGGDTLEGGAGNDSLFAGTFVELPSTPAALRKWKGGDTAKDRDVLNGGAGSDYIVAGSGDTIDGGADYDRLILDLRHERAALEIDVGLIQLGGAVKLGSTSVTGIEQVEFLRATNFADQIDYSGYINEVLLDAAGGDDAIFVNGKDNSVSGLVRGGDGNDMIEVRGFRGELDGDAGDDTLIGGTRASGGAGADKISEAYYAFGGDGNDTITVRNAKDALSFGDAGDDRLIGGRLGDWMLGGSGADVLIGGDGGDYITSSGTAQTFEPFYVRDPLEVLLTDTGAEHDDVDAGEGNDFVSVGWGDDADGGAGKDTLALSLRGASAGVTFDTGGLTTGGAVVIGTGTISGFEAVDTLIGSEFADVVRVSKLTYDAAGGDDRLTAAAAGARINGGAGDDTVYAIGKGVTFDGGDGYDTIDYSGLTRALNTDENNPYPGADDFWAIERVIATAYNDKLFALSSALTMAGAGNDQIFIDPRYGDILGVDGGDGDDRIVVGSYPEDIGRATLAGGAGYDRLQVEDDYSLNLTGARLAGDIERIDVQYLTIAAGQETGVQLFDVEYLFLDGKGTYDLRQSTVNGRIQLQNAGAQLWLGGKGMVVTGSQGTDTVYGGVGSDEINGNDGNDTLDSSKSGSTAGDRLYGDGGNDSLIGGAGADTLIGGSGTDTMAGGAGDDRYQLDDAGDRIGEVAGGGTDTVMASVDHVLAVNVENLELLYGAHRGTGNALDNTITGNDGDNLLDGKGGADRLEGRDGSDTYVIDNSGDQVIEAATYGVDLVQAYVSFTLSANVENLQMLRFGTGTGNMLGNLITGSSGSETLYGLDGNDTLDGGGDQDLLVGGLGHDTYHVDNSRDAIVEIAGEGDDKVYASADYSLSANIEQLFLSGSARVGQGNDIDNRITGAGNDDTLLGHGGLDILYGGAGNDVLIGGTGPDAMYGQSGADRFVFAPGDGNPDPYYLDGIGDFSQAEGDKIDLSQLGPLTFVGNADFTGGAQVRYDHYDGTGTLIEIDLNGDRVADMNIGLASYPALTAGDFILG